MEKLRVIIIDDEMLIRKLIRMKMDLEGLNLELAGEYQDGADAVEALDSVRPDIIISDGRAELQRKMYRIISGYQNHHPDRI